MTNFRSIELKTLSDVTTEYSLIKFYLFSEVKLKGPSKKPAMSLLLQIRKMLIYCLNNSYF